MGDQSGAVGPIDNQDFAALLTATIRRYGELVGIDAALGVARRVPRLVTNGDGLVLAYDVDHPLATLSNLIDEYDAAYRKRESRPSQEASPSMAVPASAGPIRLLLVDDHGLFRSGLNSVFAPQPDFAVVGQAESVREAIALAWSLLPDIVLMDFSLTDGTGIDATIAILARNPTTNIVFLTVHEDIERLYGAIRAGATGYLLKNIRAPELLERLRAVARGEPAISAIVALRILEEIRRSGPTQPLRLAVDLTGRELEIVRELSRGATNREIANKFVISENTVKNHVRNILAKLHLSSRLEVAAYARAHGLPHGAETDIKR